MSPRKDPQGYETKVTALADGFGLRVLKDGEIVSQSHACTKSEIGPALKEMLRWIDKTGGCSEMASASRDRMS